MSEKYEPRPFTHGEPIRALFFEGDTEIRSGASCDHIVTVMEPYITSFMPWFEVWRDGEVISKWNSVHVSGVEHFAKEELN